MALMCQREVLIREHTLPRRIIITAAQKRTTVMQ